MLSAPLPQTSVTCKLAPSPLILPSRYKKISQLLTTRKILTSLTLSIDPALNQCKNHNKQIPFVWVVIKQISPIRTSPYSQTNTNVALLGTMCFKGFIRIQERRHRLGRNQVTQREVRAVEWASTLLTTIINHSTRARFKVVFRYTKRIPKWENN
jgi:hypothetical protein